MNFLAPPRLYTESGKIRRVGFEIEFGGLSLEDTAQLIVQIHGGRIEKKHNFAYKIFDTKFGDFEVESDSRFLSQKKYDQFLKKMGIPADSFVNENFEKILEKFAGTLVPFEIAMPPIPMDQLEEAEKIRKALHENSALGISSSVFAAFGMQLNAELPDLKVETILSYLRAFLLLYDWLAEETEIVIARKIAPFIHPFSVEYMKYVLNPDYQPTLEKFMNDYLILNPTRNRPLDLLPLFTFLNQELVFQYPVEKNLIKPRPTFHYRLPNSEIDDPHWSFAMEWNKWVKIEELANDQNKIRRMSEDYLRTHDEYIFVRNPWITKTREWLDAMV